MIDETGTLSAEDVQGLQRQIEELEQRTQAQLPVLMIASTGAEPIESYAQRVSGRWQLGRRDADDGVLLIVALDDRRMRIEVGQGLEGTVTDIQAAQILERQLRPRFRGGRFRAGSAEVGPAVCESHSDTWQQRHCR